MPSFLRRALPLLAGVLLALAAHAQADESPAPPTPLPAVVVTGAREPTRTDRLAGDVVVINEQRIRASTADSVEDLLRREAGVQVLRNGAPGSSASVLIRGAGVGNTLVLVDGVRMGSASLGQAEIEAIGLASIERIEVLRGPASSLYGADGSGGVVQIFTRRGSAGPQLGAGAAIGNYGGREASFHAAGTSGGFDLATTLSSEQLDGVSTLRPGDQFGNFNPDIDDGRRRTLQAQGGFSWGGAHRVGLSHLESRLDARFDQGASGDFRGRLDSRVDALDHRATWNPAWTSLLRLSGQESDASNGATVIDRFRTQRRQAEGQATWTGAGHSVTLALENLLERVQSTTYGTDRERENNAAVLAWTGPAGGSNLQADLRQDRNSVFGHVTTGRLGASHLLEPGWRLRVLAGTSFRAPTFNDLFFPGFGVPDIKPEHGRSVELGLDGRIAAIDVSATAWHNRVDDLIVYEGDRSFCPADPSYDFGCARNIGRARLKGTSFSASTRVDGWTWRAGLELLDAKDRNSGQRLTRRAASQANASGDYRGENWSLGAALLRVGARPDSGTTLPAYTLVDLKGSWTFAPRWALEAKILNAGDVDYEPVRDYQSLGVQVWLGLRFRHDGLGSRSR